jgi:hypothetical protein
MYSLMVAIKLSRQWAYSFIFMPKLLVAVAAVCVASAREDWLVMAGCGGLQISQ